MLRRVLVLGLSLALLLGPAPLPAEPDEGPGPEPVGPSVPVVTLDALPLSVPTSGLPAPARAHAEAVLAGAVFAQRITGIRFPSQESVYRFLLDHPDFAASLVRALRLGEYRITPSEEGYWGDDARGATGTIRLLHADEQRRLFHLDGRYERRWWPTIDGQILVLLEFRHEPDERRFFRTVARVSAWANDQPELLAAALDGHPEVQAGPTLVAFRALLLADRPPAWAQAPFSLTEDAPSRDGP
jgi:hypothetical protein